MNGPAYFDTEFMKIKEGSELMSEEIKRVLLTIPGERVNNPEFGSRLRTFIFEYPSVLSASIEDIIIEDLNKWLPTIKVNKILLNFDEDNHIAKVSMTLIDSTTSEPFDYDLSLNY